MVSSYERDELRLHSELILEISVNELYSLQADPKRMVLLKSVVCYDD